MKALFFSYFTQKVDTSYEILVAKVSSDFLSTMMDRYSIFDNKWIDQYEVQLTPKKRFGFYYNSFTPKARVVLEKNALQTRITMNASLTKSVSIGVFVFAVLLLSVFSLLLIEMLSGRPIAPAVLMIPIGMLLFLLALTYIAFHVQAKWLWNCFVNAIADGKKDK